MSAWNLPLVSEHGEVAVIWQYHPYIDRATKRDITTNNIQQLFEATNKQTYKTTKYQSSTVILKRFYSFSLPTRRSRPQARQSKYKAVYLNNFI